MNNTVQHPLPTDVKAAVFLDGREVGQLMARGSLCIGSDPVSDIALDGDGIAATHCLLISNGHGVVLRDCFSKTGTYINGKRLPEATLEANTTVKIGDTELTVVLGHYDPPPVKDSNELSAERREYELQIEAAHNEIQILTERISRTKSLPPVELVEPDDDPFHDEMIELLRMEVDELQRALSEREQAAETATQLNGDSADESLPEDTELLVGRLEELLDELQQKDEQVALLHTLLETAEDANRAEQEEREQLNAWIPDIENRFAQREIEWQAKYEKLEADNLRIATERDRAEATAIADPGSAKLEAVQRLASELRTEAEALRQQMAETEKQNEHLQHELQSVQDSVSREEVVHLAQERAELARMRHELETHTQANDDRETRNKGQSVDTDIRVLRQHLLEVHEQEKQEKLERHQRSLSGRIAGLWKRIDGR
jgi:hypothetical protein